MKPATTILGEIKHIIRRLIFLASQLPGSQTVSRSGSKIYLNLAGASLLTCTVIAALAAGLPDENQLIQSRDGRQHTALPSIADYSNRAPAMAMNVNARGLFDVAVNEGLAEETMTDSPIEPTHYRF